MKKINVTLDWFPNTNHTGMFVALEKGYYKGEGLDVAIGGKVHGVMTTEGADVVVSPQPTLLVGMAAAERITAVAVLTQRCDSGILSLKEAGITRPRELTGKRLTHWDQAWFHCIVGKAVDDDGGDYGKVELIQKDVGDIVATLGAEADATWIYKNWEYFEMRHAGKDVNYFAFADFGELYDFCAPAVTAKHHLTDGDPEALKAFLGATDRGYIDAAADPEEGAALLHRHMDGWDLPLVLESQKYASGLYLAADGHWGHMRPARWDNLADWMAAEKLTPGRMPREFTNEFLPE
ncbi:MAG: ABC transporter substrate-binding protein [Clostridiales Family XIII bacterium]|jgi:ABC-type nitrate/sulfonate/bicarbonate transport system substrate-binding protein|nr:ABC transporter substrate-binding protein [Clostridiales Family XIII bacterium]